MSRIAVMQPYFFPYIAYFQLINAVDLFVVYDDGKMIKYGYVHRNSILSFDGKGKQVIYLKKKSGCYHSRINEVELEDNSFHFSKLLKTICSRYGKAPFFDDVMPVVEHCLMSKETNLSLFLQQSLHLICNYLGIRTKFAVSSDVPKDNQEGVEEKVFKICDFYGIHNYVNPIGGAEYYYKERWAAHGVNLSFLKRDDDISYPQFNYPFVRDLSIIDVMMFNSPAEIQKILNKYILV